MDPRVLSRGRDGFTLVEVLVAMVILALVLLGTQAALTDRLVRDVGAQDRRTVALHLAMDRIQAVQMEPVYTSISTVYAGTERGLPDFPSFTRITTVRRTQLDTLDYTRVTVAVTHPALRDTVARTVVVGAP